MGSSLSTADIAESLGTTPRALRKFLRSPASPFNPVGQGARYNIDSEDLVELKGLYETWVNRPGSRSVSTTAAPTTRTARKPKTKIVEKADPLSEDDLMTRLTMTVGQRQRMHGVICGYEWHHPKVKGLDITCNKRPNKGEKFCPDHVQVFFCGAEEPIDNVCGPGGKHPKPFCKYHNGDISEEELEEYLAKQPAEWD